MIKALAIDDEPIALEIIQNLAIKIPFLELVASFTNALDSANFLMENKIDLIFLDINMPDLSGIDFVKSIPVAPMIIFTTGYSEHAVQSFEFNTIDYLLKPFSFARFLKACTKAYELAELRDNYSLTSKSIPSLFIKSGYENVRIELDEILYIESVGNYVQFILTQNKRITSRLNMNEVLLMLPKKEFLRIHRGYIVSRKAITKFNKRSIWIEQNELPLGTGYHKILENLR
ncbi:LytR/AlgR family response regulator transcription factor [Mucilaginibacter lappiensis]|uniref:DNA-binding LytR/AlgR family response regulator n=1 Tax=Mucilaginibacter lappiensis TaxID=354630 RepID=A0A841JFE8_9SPHI|nr:LytTR family DNA-binding domain-containing protein [Mucilaginibacter lappiensis]MBB6127185.1 DNA-binding LytR/AlgR family response regulator [Mucilaginibacter lappiensis]